MSDDDHLDVICSDYLVQLDAALADLSAGDRRQIIEQISEHITSARAALPQQSEVEVRDILERLGSPEDIAAEARTEGAVALRRDRRLILIASCVLVGLAVVGLGVAAGSGAFSSGGTTTPNRSASVTNGAASGVTVPNVTGLRASSATALLNSAGLGYVLRYAASNHVPGTVLQQSPSAGSVLRESSKISLIVSGTQNATSVSVPDVLGQSQAQAQATLTAAGLDVTIRGPAPSATVPIGVVFAQSPAAGSKMHPQSDVLIMVSAGP